MRLAISPQVRYTFKTLRQNGIFQKVHIMISQLQKVHIMISPLHIHSLKQSTSGIVKSGLGII